MDCKQTHGHRMTDTYASLWTQKSKNLNKPSMSVVNAGPPDTEYLYYPLDVEGVTLIGSLFLSSYKIKQIIIITVTRISTNIIFIGQFQFSF